MLSAPPDNATAMAGLSAPPRRTFARDLRQKALRRRCALLARSSAPFRDIGGRTQDPPTHPTTRKARQAGKLSGKVGDGPRLLRDEHGGLGELALARRFREFGLGG